MDIDVTMVAIISPLVIALVELGKRAGLPNRWAGIVAAALGIALAALWALSVGRDVPAALWAGLIAGLSAAGVYSGQKAARIG
ncbi:MAG TPA: hypothetical protein PK593_00160 [Thermomicrobiales bacterium]|nr:hypothetical protein [Thermomicrobiales bacterium]